MNKDNPEKMMKCLDAILTEAYDENGNPIRVNPNVKFKMPGVKPNGRPDVANNQNEWGEFVDKSENRYVRNTPLGRQWAEIKKERGDKYPSFNSEIEDMLEDLLGEIKEIFPEVRGLKSTEQQKQFIKRMDLWVKFQDLQADEYYNDDDE